MSTNTSDIFDGPSEELLAAAKPAAPQEDKLDIIRAKVARVRDLLLKVKDLEEQINDANIEIKNLTWRDLPDLFTVAQIRTIGLDAKGNLPAYDAKLATYYHASIPVGWEEPRRSAGFAVLLAQGAEDLIKTVVSIPLGKGEIRKLDTLLPVLDGQGVKYYVKMDVHWGLLRTWLKGRYEGSVKRPLMTDELEKIGGTVAPIVDVAPRKD